MPPAAPDFGPDLAGPLPFPPLDEGRLDPGVPLALFGFPANLRSVLVRSGRGAGAKVCSITRTVLAFSLFLRSFSF